MEFNINKIYNIVKGTVEVYDGDYTKDNFDHKIKCKMSTLLTTV